MATKKTGRAKFWSLSAISGIISAGVFLAAAELLALLVAREGSPILAIGSFVIDIVPRPLKEFAITTFGFNDKLALLAGLALAVVIASAIAGIVQYVKPPLGIIALGVAGALSVAAIVTRAGATPLAAVPPIVGTIAGSYVLWLLITRLHRWALTSTCARHASGDATAVNPDAAATGTATPAITKPSVAVPTVHPRKKDLDAAASTAAASTASASTAASKGDKPLNPSVDRRRFFVIAGIASASAVVVGVGSRVISATTSSITAARKALNIPAPKNTVTVPAGAELDVEGIAPLYTPNADFYRIDTALTVPSIDPNTWSLKITGMVDGDVTLSFDDLVGMGLDEYSITMTCVSNEVGGNLVGTAKWLGVPIRDVLNMAGVKSGADMVLSTSVDGYTASTPLDALLDENLDAILAVAMNGEPLPLEHGFPVRMVVPGLYGYVSATKWLTELKVTTFADDEAYWTPRGYSAEAPIKFSSRIDTPKPGTPVAAGRTAIGGVAWAQTVGIESVEVSIDNGDWQPATLSSPVNNDTWVQWFVDWEATSGTHYLAVRATNKNGDLQVEERAAIAPNGSSGWQRTLVTVSS